MMDAFINATPALKKQLETEEDREEWMNLHITLFCSMLNEKRGYVGNRLKVALKEWLVMVHGGKICTKTFANFPSPDDIKRCAFRDVDLDIPEGAETNCVIKESKDGQLMYFYIEECLAKAIGRQGFNQNVRHYFTVSEARFPLDRKLTSRYGVVSPTIYNGLTFFFVLTP